MGASYLGDMLEAVRDAAEDGLDPARTGHALPNHVLVTQNAPAVDLCTDDGVLAVYVWRAPHIHPRTVARMPSTCLVTVTAELVIELWRCVPTLDDEGNPRPDVDYENSALDLATDLWCMLTHLYVAWQDGDLGAPCKAVTFGAVQPLGPSGGVAGWRIPLTVHLSDATPAGLAS